ncbi:hypothetical protein [Herpetosiphon llansteffanensis]|uniref:hypothetical protein n=1 Tax=Herpetosiphon llansteffanensis TaxID=2094568 RepID=UPI000D7C1F4A|nr:hypothetical protein [Herpetosiphon llansteffanensis]
MTNADANIPWKVQAMLTETVQKLFWMVLAERHRQDSEHNLLVPRPDIVPQIIAAYSIKNAVVAASSSLVPGPLGMLTALPEVILVLRNQLRLIYDIGVAHGQSHDLKEEVLAGVLASSLGVGTMGVLADQGGRLLIRKASTHIFTQVSSLIGRKVAQQALSSQISKWLPGLGAVAMAAWSRYTTMQVGKKANSLLSCPIVITADTPVADPLHPKATTLPSLERIKIDALINLVTIDRDRAPSELAFIDTILMHSEFDPAMLADIHQSLISDEPRLVDYTRFIDDPDASLGLLIDLVALAQRHGGIHITEAMYIKQVGRILGYESDDILMLLEGNVAMPDMRKGDL